jgi:hypothetical protein
VLAIDQLLQSVAQRETPFAIALRIGNRIVEQSPGLISIIELAVLNFTGVKLDVEISVYSIAYGGITKGKP